MKLIETKLKDCYIIEPDVFGDDRGWFMESFNLKKLEDSGLHFDAEFVQDNHSYSKAKNTIRGLHFQTNPYAQTKIVRCTRGILIDVVVDLRKSSETYKQWIAVELSSENKRMLYVPRGFAHGFKSVTEDVEIQYKTDNYYSKEHDGGVLWSDPELGINWNLDGEPTLSEKDKNAPVLSMCKADFK